MGYWGTPFRGKGIFQLFFFFYFEGGNTRKNIVINVPRFQNSVHEETRGSLESGRLSCNKWHLGISRTGVFVPTFFGMQPPAPDNPLKFAAPPSAGWNRPLQKHFLARVTFPSLKMFT
ncbi:hypothetical protein CEXT_9661 [Caerostris extrusa]|uniref:Uncharacterized protein n=1 Tax=Caerostris extrusa TaxID=172846 RepID=A0AAV4TKZ2_CAEEX|nr:hypothetical protein CEXT_9661 [Caerostris extrusa]